MRKSIFTEHEKAEAIVNEETDDLEMEFVRKSTEMDKILLQLIQVQDWFFYVFHGVFKLQFERIVQLTNFFMPGLRTGGM